MMSGINGRKISSGSSQDSRYGSFPPPSRSLIEGYQTSLTSSPSHGRNTYSLSRSTRPWNPQDTVSNHYLMETAMADSQAFEVLPPDEIEAIRKQLVLLKTRIEGTKRKLVLESKMRDASQSIGRLNGSRDPGAVRGHGPYGSDGSAGGSSIRSEETKESARKCDDYAHELWQMEKEEQETSRRLLEHTAGILQLTHKGYLKEPSRNEVTRDGLVSGQELLDFGDLSHYAPYPGGSTNGDILKDDFHGAFADLQHQTEMILGVAKRVEELNSRLRNVLLELKPRNDVPQLPHEFRGTPSELENVLVGQFDFLEQCIDAMRNLQSGRRSVQGNIETEEKLELFNTQLFQIMTDSNPEQASKYTPPPDATGQNMQHQLDYMEGGLGAVGKRLKYLGDLVDSSSSKLTSYQDRAEQYVQTIGGLWDMFNASETSNPHQKEDFSLKTFAAKVEAMHSQFSHMQTQKDVLTRQIHQQRELNEMADTTKDKRMNDQREEIEQLNEKLTAQDQETNVLLEKLTVAIAQVEAANEASQSRSLASSAQSEALEHESQLRTKAEVDIQQLTHNLHEAKEQAAVMQVSTLALKSDLDIKATAAATAESTISTLESELARLQTELTIVRAELDGIHGTKAQRAAEQAGDPRLLRERDALQARATALHDELHATIADYEAMTHAAIAHEREREQLEAAADVLRARVDVLEGDLAEERVQALGAKSPGMLSNASGGGGASTSAGVLKMEFKKMMKETRMEHQRALKVELDERRKLEGTVRSLKKDLAAGKGSSAH